MINIIAPYIGLAIVIVTMILFWHLADKGDHHKSGKHKPRK
ncbi:MAG: hypothetical protein PVI75_08740 [Gammaproteobacteria bacterium]|jgi:hypothetical protein